MKKIMLSLAFIALLLLTGCGIGLNVGRDAQGNTTITIKLDENRVNDIVRTAISQAKANGANLLADVTAIDLKPGVISIVGNVTTQDGQIVPGSLDLLVNVENGLIRVTAQNVNVNGAPVDQAIVDQLNQQIAAGISAAITTQNAKLTGVTISDTSLDLLLTLTQ